MQGTPVHNQSNTKNPAQGRVFRIWQGQADSNRRPLPCQGPYAFSSNTSKYLFTFHADGHRVTLIVCCCEVMIWMTPVDDSVASS